MINKNKVLALIPARANSIELPKKNFKFFCNKPLIKWTLEAANRSRYIDKTIISSDSKKILKIASKYKNFDLNTRPKKLSESNSKIFDLINYEIKKYKKYDILILLQPTSPLRTHKHIDESLRLMIKNSRKSCVSFISLKYDPNSFYSISRRLKVKKLRKKKLSLSNRQQRKVYYYPSGDIYISYISRLKSNRHFIDNKTYPYLIKKNFSSDIDNIFDFKSAEFKKKNQRKFK